jgi:hypothetical protein
MSTCIRNYDWCDGGICGAADGYESAPVHRNRLSAFGDTISIEVCYDENDPDTGVYFYASAQGELDHTTAQVLRAASASAVYAVEVQWLLFERLRDEFPAKGASC